MKNKAKAFGIICAICVLAYLGMRTLTQPSSASNAIPDPDNFSPNYRYSGVTMAPVPVELSGDSWMLSSLTEAKLWKFAVKIVNPEVKVGGQLEVREKGKAPKVLCVLDPTSLAFDRKIKKGYLYVGIMPLNAGFSEAEKIRCQIMFGAMTRTSTPNNPFKNNLSSATGLFNSTQQQDIALFSVRILDKPNLTKYHDLTLFLKLKTEMPQ